MKTKLRVARKKKKLTQEEMAKKLGYKSKSQYCMLENGQRKITIGIALAIAKILEQPVEELFDDTLSENRNFTGTEG